MAQWNIICKKWCRRLTGGFDPAGSVAPDNQHLYEREVNGQPKIYGCSGEVGFQHEAPTEPDECPRCHCPKNDSPPIKAEKVKEDSIFNMDWCFDYYQVLRVSPTASKTEIKKAYLRLMSRFHADKFRNKGADEQKANNNRTADFNKAWEMLKDDAARKRFDGAYLYMAFQCPGCLEPGIKRSNPNTCVRSSSAQRYFHSKNCARAWCQANDYLPVSVHGWTEDGQGKKPEPEKNSNKLPTQKCAGCQKDRPFSRHFWVRWSESNRDDYCCTEKCLFDYWTKKGGNYPNGKPVRQCYFCGTVKKENNSTTWQRETDPSSKIYNLIFCSLEHLREAEKKAEMGLGSFGSGSGGPNINKKRQEFIQELLGLDGWDELSNSEQDGFVNEVNRSQPDRFPAIKARVLTAIGQKGGDRDDPLQKLKSAVIAEIDSELLKEPEIRNSELDSGNQNWGDAIQNATNPEQVRQIKDNVCADIERKRQAKQGGGGNNQLTNLRQEAINKIRTELEKEPVVDKSELINQNWEADLDQAQTEKAIKELRDQILADIYSKRAAKQEASRLNELLTQAKQKENWNNYQNLANILKQIKQLRSSNAYQEKKSEIQSIEDKLRELNPGKWKETASELLDQLIKNNGLNDNNMDKETKAALREAKEDPNNKEKLAKAEERICQNGANNNLSNLITSLRNKLRKGNLTKEEKEAAINEIMKFIITENKYQRDAYKFKRHEVDALLAELRGEKENQEGVSLTKIIFITALITLPLIIVFILILRARRRRLN
jgi:curved DNA-binding protein CbpA